MNWVIVVAGGNGERVGMSKNKIFANVGSKPIIYWTLKTCQDSDSIDKIIISTRAKDSIKMEQLVATYNFSKVVRIFPSQNSRQNSASYIFSQLGSSIAGDDLVGIHNGANPFVTGKELQDVYEAARNNKAALLAYPATDTIKITDGSRRVMDSPTRKNCWCAQTPQVARYCDLSKAYQHADANNFIGTDDTQLLEQIGIQAVVVPCSRLNFKITYTEDIYLARKRLPIFLKSND